MEGSICMKHIKTIAVVAVLGLTMGGYAVVQIHRGAGPHGMDDAAMVGHISEVFGKFAAFDLDKNGKLDAAEKESLAKAIDNGSLVLPPNTPPKEIFPSDEERMNHMVEMYARFAVYDANHDGDLDSIEQAAVQKAMESGELGFPGGHGLSGMHRPHELGRSLHWR